VERIHYGALDVLEKTGVTFDDDEALTIMEEGGCGVEKETKRVRIPAWLVEKSLDLSPSSFTVKARNPKFDLRIGGSTVYYSSFPAMGIFDLEAMDRRTPVLDDQIMMVRLIDAIDEIHFCFSPLFALEDKPQEVVVEWLYLELFRNTEKTTIGPGMFGCAPWIIEMAEATGQQVLAGISITPPLTYPPDMVSALIAYAKKGYPILFNLCLAIGSTGPATLAGSLVQQTAEAMAGTVLAQLVQPGVGVLWNTYSQIMDMRYGSLAPGAIENSLIAAALCQQCRHYNIPGSAFVPQTDAKTHDEQAGYEKALTLLKVVEAGSHLTIFNGGIDDESCVSPIQMIIDTEIGEMVARMVEGIEVNDDTLAVDLIEKVGPIPGHFLGEKHTMERWQKEQFIPKISERRPYSTWKKEGSKDIVERAKERYKQIMENHEPFRLPEDVDQELMKIMKRCEKEKLQ
jgi:trimethylamine--corrinoid protein Co-methyltransferase